MTTEPECEQIAKEISGAMQNGNVGHRLVSEDDEVRVWSINLEPGERIGFHRHQLNYCWIAITAGRSTSRMSDGRLVETIYEPGDCRYFHFGPGEYMVHDLTNTGDTALQFTTIEMKRSPNRPLPIN